MADYDSDSSLSDAEVGSNAEYIRTKVLLGYASDEAKGDKFSQLGGYPTWLDGKTPPSGALAKCKVCNDYLSLLLQLDGDLPNDFAGHERKLYIFGCRRKSCRRKQGSIRGIRGVRISKAQSSESIKASASKAAVSTSERTPPPQNRNIGGSLFGVTTSNSGGSSNINPFSSGSAIGTNPFSKSSTANAANPFASPSSLQPETSIPTINEPTSVTTNLAQSFADKVKLTSDVQKPAAIPRPHEPWPDQSKFPPAYPKYFLDADYEELDNPKQPALPAGVRLDTDMTDETDASGSGSGAGGADSNKALFESSMDKAFQKFADRVEQNPEQVLRYEFNGTPLLYSADDVVGKTLALPTTHAASSSKISTSGRGMPHCENCGAKRTFELQLTPHAIAELEADDMDNLDGMDWGTIILGVCSRDCQGPGVGDLEVGYVEEWVGVQWEELSGKKR